MHRLTKRSKMQNAPEARSELRYVGTSPLDEEIRRMKRAVEAAGGFKDCFMTAPSPGIVSTTMLNAYYDSQESYLSALARELNKQYRAIHDAGFLLQIDSPDLAIDRSMFYLELSDS